MELAALLARDAGVVGRHGLLLLLSMAFSGDSSDFGVGEGRGAVRLGRFSVVGEGNLGVGDQHPQRSGRVLGGCIGYWLRHPQN
jgi:hypothetical protein